MEYKQLSAEFIADAIAANMYHREVEHFQYQLNIDTYEATIATLPDGDPHKDRLRAAVVAEKAQQAVGEKAYAALETLVKDPVAHAAAVERVRTKREAQEAAALAPATSVTK